jgi:predicted nucleic acid-binding protein
VADVDGMTPPNWSAGGSADKWTESVLPSALQRMARAEHLSNADKPIVGANEAGVFPASQLKSVPPVVADANVLCRDIFRACRQQGHTVLVNAVNAGMMRLYGARHVIDEVDEHAEEWCEEEGMPVDKFLDRWETNYVPLIRLVDIQDGLLSPAEQERIDLLDHGPPELWDPDDVPTATLALQLGAFLLSQDAKLLRAVYGPDADFERHYNWLTVLRGGSDAGVTGEMSQSMVEAMAMVGGGVFMGLKWVWNVLSPAALVALGITGAVVAYRASPETRHKVLRTGGTIMETVSELRKWCEAANADFLRAAPEIPTWAALTRTSSLDAVLTRACLHTLARSPMTDRSAVELTADLPRLPVPQGEAKVRAVLRTGSCFEIAYRGRWQVGVPVPAVRPSAHIANFASDARTPRKAGTMSYS